MAEKCVRDRLLSIVDDMEMIAKELLEIVLTPKPLRPNQMLDSNQLADLLVAKDRELKAELRLAKEQEDVHKSMCELREEVDKHDQQIRQLQKNLKEAEHILSTAIYQAKHKLQIISKATTQPMQSEELIRYAHKISAAHSVSAPYNWEIGDQRRPYPTDVEMRSGLLANASDPTTMSNIIAQQSHQMNTYGSGAQTAQQQQQEMGRPPSTASNSSNSSFAWGQDVKPNVSALSGAGYPPPPAFDNKGNKDTDDVEVMSTLSHTTNTSLTSKTSIAALPPANTNNWMNNLTVGDTTYVCGQFSVQVIVKYNNTNNTKELETGFDIPKGAAVDVSKNSVEEPLQTLSNPSTSCTPRPLSPVNETQLVFPSFSPILLEAATNSLKRPPGKRSLGRTPERVRKY